MALGALSSLNSLDLLNSFNYTRCWILDASLLEAFLRSFDYARYTRFAQDDNIRGYTWRWDTKTEPCEVFEPHLRQRL